MTDDDFRIDDLVYHLVIGDEDDEQRYVGYVTGFCPAQKWVRVRTLNGRRHVWAKENVENISAQERYCDDRTK